MVREAYQHWLHCQLLLPTTLRRRHYHYCVPSSATISIPFELLHGSALAYVRSVPTTTFGPFPAPPSPFPFACHIWLPTAPFPPARYRLPSFAYPVHHTHDSTTTCLPCPVPTVPSYLLPPFLLPLPCLVWVPLTVQGRAPTGALQLDFPVVTPTQPDGWTGHGKGQAVTRGDPDWQPSSFQAKHFTGSLRTFQSLCGHFYLRSPTYQLRRFIGLVVLTRTYLRWTMLPDAPFYLPACACGSTAAANTAACLRTPFSPVTATIPNTIAMPPAATARARAAAPYAAATRVHPDRRMPWFYACLP